MYQSANFHHKVLQSRGLKQETFIFSKFWRLEAQDHRTSRLGFCEVSLLSLQTVTSLWVITWPFFCMCRDRVSVCTPFLVSVPLLLMTPIGLSSHPYDLFALITTLKAPISKYSHGGLRIQHMNFEWGRSVCVVAQ